MLHRLSEQFNLSIFQNPLLQSRPGVATAIAQAGGCYVYGYALSLISDFLA